MRKPKSTRCIRRIITKPHRFIQHNIQDLDPTHSAFQLQDTAAIKDTDQSAYWFNFVDTDGNGALCGNELMASLSEGGRLSMQELLMHVDEILELDDHDGDGLISFKEFQESEAY